MKISPLGFASGRFVPVRLLYSIHLHWVEGRTEWLCRTGGAADRPWLLSMVCHGRKYFLTIILIIRKPEFSVRDGEFLVREDESCLLSECLLVEGLFANLMWVHKAARNHEKWFSQTDKLCSCRCKSRTSWIRSCRINETLVIKEEQERMGCKGLLCLIRGHEI